MQKENIKKIIPYVQTSLHLCKESLSELLYITQSARSEYEISIVSGRPFNFYGITLQYCFIMEYTKLLEQKFGTDQNNVASLFRLVNSIKNLGKEFEVGATENKHILSGLVKSLLFEKLKKLRNKKFGHAEIHEINDPMKIRGLTGREMEEMVRQMEIMLSVANNCFGSIGYNKLLIVSDDRTKNFIKYHAVYKQYYHDNFPKAYSEGYVL